MKIKYLLFVLTAYQTSNAGNWPNWRGPNGNGIATQETAPLRWSQEENVLWKTPLPSPGNSSPIVWEDRVFITSAEDDGRLRSLICFDRKTGHQLWKQNVSYNRPEATHRTNPQCAASPTTDGKIIAVHFGSAGAYAFDYQGNLIWQRPDIGTIDHIWGYAASPVDYKNTIIQYIGPGTKVAIAALDKVTGETRWRRELSKAQAKAPKQFFGSWGTPQLRSSGGQYELIVALPENLIAIDPDTGNDLWNCRGLGPLVYTNPLVSGETVCAMSGYHGPALAVKVPVGVKGDLTSKRLWKSSRKPPQRIGSGVAFKKHIYILNEPGVAACIEIDTGKETWKERLGTGNSWGSMNLVGNRIYVTNTTGQTHVIAPNPERLELLATNSIGEMTRASAAFSDGQVFIRTYNHLWCIGD